MSEKMTEVVGTPGSGKTTWAMRQRRSLLHYSDVTRWQRYRAACYFCVFHPILTFRLMRLSVSSDQSMRLMKYKLVSCLFRALAVERKAQRSRGDVVIDEGIFQYVFSAFEHKISSGESKVLRKVIASLPSRHIIWFECSGEERRQRMLARGRTPRANFDAGYREKWLNAMDCNGSCFVSLIRNSENIIYMARTG